MNTPECDNLDAYLCGWLSEEEAASFEAHLGDCAACRQEAEQQRRIDQLLAQGAGRVEAIPSSLVDGIERRIRRLRRRRMMRWSLGLSTAVAVMLAVAVGLTLQRGGGPPEAKPIAQQPKEPERAQHEVAPRVQFASDDVPPARVSLVKPSEGILVPMETSNPNVSIVWIYPTVKPARAAGKPDDRVP